MKKILRATLIALGAVTVLAACGTAVERRREALALEYLNPANLIGDNYRAADTLIAQAGAKLDRSVPIIVGTIVKVDDLYVSSTFGRVTSENIASRLTQAGYKVIEMKLAKSVYMKRNEGELVLTREIQEIAKMHDAQAIVVGSYGVAARSVLVNVKLVSPTDSNVVIASTDYSVSKVEEIDRMLNRN